MRRSEGLVEPVPREVARILRAEVLRLATQHRRRRAPSVVSVGPPGGQERHFRIDPGEPFDLALRADVLAALLRHCGQVGRPLIRLSREGRPSVQDLDLEWLAATRTVLCEAQRAADLVVVTRFGWRDPRSDLQRTWLRIRDRPTTGT